MKHKKPDPPSNPILPPEDFIGLLPNPEEVHSHAPAPSPITPLNPTNPTIFPPNSNPSPTTPQIYNNPTPFSTPAPNLPSPSTVRPVQPPPSSAADGGFQPSPEQIQKAQKFCKYATSALNYDDVKTALDNLQKAMNLLKTGSE